MEDDSILLGREKRTKSHNSSRTAALEALKKSKIRGEKHKYEVGLKRLVLK